MKISIFSQILPFIVKDENKIESAHAYNTSIEHIMTSLTILSIGLYS